jgi:outer membrane protein assembly factor BamB
MSNADFGPAKDWDIVLRKIEAATGEEVWVKNYGSPVSDRNQDILVLADGNLLLMAMQDNPADTTRMLFLKINPANGDIIWESLQPNWGAQYTIRGAATPDGGAVVVFQGSIQHPAAPGGFASWQLQGLRLSPTGEVVWREWFEPTWSPVLTSGNSYIEDVVALQDGSILAMGLEEKSSGLVLRIDAENGSTIFATTLDSVASSNDRRAISTVEAPNGDLLVLSRNYNYTDSLWLYRLSPNGAILLRKGIKYGEYHFGSSFHRAPDGGLLLVLSFRNGSFFSGPSGLRILRMTDDFEVLAETILYEDELRPNGATLLPDGSLALTGFIRPTNSADMFLMKTLPVPLVATNELWANSSLKVFPNPVAAGQELQISLENDYRGRIKVEFLGLDGRVLQSFFEEKTDQQLRVHKGLPGSFAGNLFIVRVSDGEGAAARVVMRF